MPIAELSQSSGTQSNGPLKGKCCSLPGQSLKGTYFFGGAGIEGSYIESIVAHLKNSGIRSAIYVDRDKWSGVSRYMDATVGVLAGRNYDPRFPMLLRVQTNNYPQFNLIGYSYGSILAAQLGMKYALGGTKVDNVVLIGSPLSYDFSEALRKHPNIRNLVLVNLTDQGDPIYPGMSVQRLVSTAPIVGYQTAKRTGHFYYSATGDVGDKRRKELAEFLYETGIR